MIRRLLQLKGSALNLGSQSPDGDFFDPEEVHDLGNLISTSCHSPLTGIFLIRSPAEDTVQDYGEMSHSPLTGIFLIRSSFQRESHGRLWGGHSPLTGIFLIRRNATHCNRQLRRRNCLSQSPDGDFFDPEELSFTGTDGEVHSHSPLTGIFLIRRFTKNSPDPIGTPSQSPDGDFFDPEAKHNVSLTISRLSHSPLTGIFLIRRNMTSLQPCRRIGRHSPLTGIFLIRSRAPQFPRWWQPSSQSPDGDFFDPEFSFKDS